MYFLRLISDLTIGFTKLQNNLGGVSFWDIKVECFVVFCLKLTQEWNPENGFGIVNIEKKTNKKIAEWEEKKQREKGRKESWWDNKGKRKYKRWQSEKILHNK